MYLCYSLVESALKASFTFLSILFGYGFSERLYEVYDGVKFPFFLAEILIEAFVFLDLCCCFPRRIAATSSPSDVLGSTVP